MSASGATIVAADPLQQSVPSPGRNSRHLSWIYFAPAANLYRGAHSVFDGHR